MNNIYDIILTNRAKSIKDSNIYNDYDDNTILSKLREKLYDYKLPIEEALKEAIKKMDIEFIDYYIVAKDRNLLSSMFEYEYINLDESLRLKLKNNSIFLEEIIEKENSLNIKEFFIFKILEFAEYNNIIDGNKIEVLKIIKQKGGEFLEDEIEISDINSLYKAYSSKIVSLLSTNSKLFEMLNKNVYELISRKTLKKVATYGWGIVIHNGTPTIPETIQSSKIYYSETFNNFMFQMSSTTYTNLEKEEILFNLANLNKPHNLLIILSLISSLCIHLYKPLPLPHVFIWGASGVGKTSTAEICSFVRIPQTTSTVHQFLGFTSGFRVGLAFFDEKTSWGGQLLQEVLKQGATNLGKVWRKSRDVLYICNMQILNISNPRPTFIVNSETELKAIARRCWFLEVDENDSGNFETYIEYLELRKFKLFKIIMDELLKMEFPPFKYEGKFEYLEEIYKIYYSIIERDKDIDIDLIEKTYKELINRMKSDEKSIFVEEDILDIIKGIVLDDQITVAQKLKKQYFVNEVIKMNFNINGYTMMRDKLVLSKRGWKKISEKTGLPNLSSYKDIERYLTSQGISAEHKSVRIVDKIIRLIVIEGDFLEDFEIDMDIEEYINMQGGEVPKDELIKIFGEYVVNKALKDGRIYEPKAGYCRVL